MRKSLPLITIFVFCCSLFCISESYAWFGKSSKKSSEEEISSEQQKVEKKAYQKRKKNEKERIARRKEGELKKYDLNKDGEITSVEREEVTKKHAEKKAAQNTASLIRLQKKLATTAILRKGNE